MITAELDAAGLTALLTEPADRSAEPPEPAEATPARRDDRGTRHTKIMIVDDESILIRVVRKYLQEAGYDGVFGTTDPTETMTLIERERPDVLLLDIMMQQLSGLDVLRLVRRDKRLKHMPVLILTASSDAATKVKALELGATDFLIKPVDASELVARVRNALVVKAYQDHLEHYAEQLADEVRMRTAELAASRQEVILCLARAAEFRDNDTGRHIIRVGRYAGIIARALGFADDEATCLELAAQLHDVGKIAVPDAILRKPGSLETEEFEIMKKHCAVGGNIIQGVPDADRDTLRRHGELGGKLLEVRSSPIMRMASRIALTHHEKWDGSGYPLGLAGKVIPIEGRITAVADVFDALTTKRPYKPALPLDESLQIMREKRGTHFDPTVLDAFLARRADIVQVQVDLADKD
jgi:putative two-component system response regulator